MAATVTVTGKIGPGNTLTAVVYSGVENVNFDCVNNILTLTTNDLAIPCITITAAGTITATKSGSTYTFTIS